MDKTVEMEMKLTIARKDLKKLLASELITAKTIKGSLAKQELLTTYYDTESYKLTEAGMAYRIRHNGKKYEATIKIEQSSGGGLSVRREFNIPLKKDAPLLSGFAELGLEADLEELLAGEELQKLFTVEVKREVRLLQVTPATVLKMAID
ncbi:MAG: CYTH domain-containing protein [Acidaminococcaceae bacterium]|nr:CYTH domain-containing protein [Acidaminococcaceae bacterium]